MPTRRGRPARTRRNSPERYLRYGPHEVSHSVRPEHMRTFHVRRIRHGRARAHKHRATEGCHERRTEVPLFFLAGEPWPDLIIDLVEDGEEEHEHEPASHHKVRIPSTKENRASMDVWACQRGGWAVDVERVRMRRQVDMVIRAGGYISPGRFDWYESTPRKSIPMTPATDKILNWRSMV